MAIDEKIELNLSAATRAAELGCASVMERSLHWVRVDAEKLYAEQPGILAEINHRIAEIERRGYTAAIPVYLEMARKFGEYGSSYADVTETFLKAADKCSGIVGQDISAKVAGIRALIPPKY